VEDWEQHFLEKSRRRSEMERGERSRAILKAGLAAALVAALVLGAIVALALFA
jgi:hypothetical protein